MRQEVMMLKNYPHPLVIKYIDSFRDEDDNAYLVTELASGFDLKKEMLYRFKNGRYFSDDES
jgi:serine/threonine protein kinase